jgi:tetratricopeptide (TPR) repeat protein
MRSSPPRTSSGSSLVAPLARCLAAAAAVFALACTQARPATPTTSAASAAPDTAAPTAAATAPPATLPFIEDDYPRALAEARAKHRPLFVDTWATWCHACISMRAYVFPDPQLRALASDFVWAAIDTERPENAKWVETHAQSAWPTLWVIDPETERVVLKWSNTATAPELVSLLGDARAAMQRGDTRVDAGAALVRGNQASAAGKIDEAITEYRAALKLAPPDWPRRPNAVEALIERLNDKKDTAACAAVAESELPSLPGGTSKATTAILGLDCASHLPPSAAAGATKERLVAEVRRMAADLREPLLADDRSGLFETLVEVLEDDKRGADAREVARAWAAFLEGEAKKATTPTARMVFDPHRLNAYLELGTPQRALPMLEESERDFPTDYNPKVRIARVYFELHEWNDALAAVDRALPLAYGPRKLRVYSLRADILAAKGDKAATAATLRQALEHARTMTLTGGYAKLRTELEGRLRALESGVK